MTTKEYLSNYRKYRADMIFYETQKEDAIENIASIKSPAFGDKVQSSPKNDPIGNLVIEYQREIGRYDLEILNCRTMLCILDNQLDGIREIDSTYYMILVYRYKNGLGWDEIAKKLGYSISYATHVHSPALKKFEEIYGKYYLNS